MSGNMVKFDRHLNIYSMPVSIATNIFFLIYIQADHEDICSTCNVYALFIYKCINVYVLDRVCITEVLLNFIFRC